MIVDNIELCIKHFKSLGIPEEKDSSNNIYFVVKIYRRNKDFRTEDNPFPKKDWGIRTFRFTSIEELRERWEDIKTLCKAFKARAYFEVNLKSKQKLLVRNIQRLVSYIGCCNLGNIWSLYDSEEAQSFVVRKLFVVDIDNEPIDSGVVQEIQNLINTECRPSSIDNKILSVIPTVTGVHLICTPFVKKDLIEKCGEKGIQIPDIQLYGLSMLYFNNEG